MPDILSESFQVHVWSIPDIYHAYSFRVIRQYSWNIPGLFLCLRIGPGQQQCDWDATAVTVHVFWVSMVFSVQRPTWRARILTPERQQMQPYVAQHRL